MDLLDSWRRLLDRMVLAADRATAVDDCLDALMDILEADRGLVLVRDADGVPFALNARGHNRALTPSEREEVSGSIIERALAERRCVVWDNGERLAAGSMMRFGILTALAAPLYAPHEGLEGALYVDFRAGHRLVTPAQVSLFELASTLVATVLAQARRLQVVSERVRRLEADASHPEATRPGLDEIIAGQGLARLQGEILSAVHGRSPLLVLGESGTGKTLLAEAMAEASARGPVIRAVLGTSDDLNTITSELFGHERGAFSGALAKRTGLVELAHGGTLIFDELLNLPTPAQKLLLDFTQFGTFRPLGWDKREPKRATVRFIACTNGDVDAALADGRLRADLYYRLAGARLALPPLRERRADIPRLVAGYLARSAGRWVADPELLSVLAAPAVRWPGNVRQLESVLQRAVERATLEGGGRTLGRRHVLPGDLEQVELPAPVPLRLAVSSEPHAGASSSEDLLRAWQELRERRAALDEAERRLIEGALGRAAGVVAHAARELGTSRTGLLSRMQTLGVSRVKSSEPTEAESRGDVG